jgi:hypothetical protein
MSVRTLTATADGVISGVRVIAVHGHLHTDATPGRAAPVYADGHHRLVRIVEVERAPEGFKVLVETASPPLPETGELPGFATRIGPWPARLDDHVVVVGSGEIAEAHRLLPRRERAEPPRVEAFVRWLRSGRERDDALQAMRAEGGATWYCTQAESFALFERIHRVVREELFDALRDGVAGLIEDRAFWLSRTAIADMDIWLAGAALKRVWSPDWEVVIREGLHLPADRDVRGEIATWERDLDHLTLMSARGTSDEGRDYPDRARIIKRFFARAEAA